ncbi:MAG: hypothetical protein HQL33_09355 [Alphaproteobacteria bacterium]|nr:hypothetical protein [Alphaproteobacteria bacterium]
MTKRGVAHWVAGIVIALIGVGVARFRFGEVADTVELLLSMAGIAIVFAGLYVIGRGVGSPPSPSE